MERSAIERIEELAAAGPITESALEQNVAMCVPTGCELKDLERFRTAPRRMRQKFRTERIEDFIHYVENSRNTATAVYVSPDGSTARAIIDHGTHDDPEWGEHIADLVLARTPAYKAMRELCGSARSQQQLIDYLEDWACDGLIQSFHNDTELSSGAAIAAIRKVTLNASASSTHEEGDMRAKRSRLEEIAAQGAEGNLPTRFVLLAPMYVGLDVRDFHVRLGITSIDDRVERGPAFRLRILREELIRQAIAEEVEGKLRAAWMDVCVFIGEAERPR